MAVHIREKEKANGERRLYLDIYHEGRRRWESLGLTITGDKTQDREKYRLAETIRAKREIQLFQHANGLLDTVAAKKSLLRYAEEQAKDMPPKNHLPKSIKYLEEFDSNIRLESIDARWLEGYQKFLLSKGLKASTASHYYEALKHLLTIAVRDGLIIKNAGDQIKGIKIPESVRVFLSLKEIETLRDTELGGVLGAEVKRAFLFACFVGLRISDIKGLTWGNIELSTDNPSIYMRQQKTQGIVSIPLHKNALKFIWDGETIHKKTEKVFPGLSNSKTNTNQYLTMWAEKAGIEKKIGWHTARHSFAMLAREYGKDIFVVSQLLGHKKVSTTQIYAKITDGAKRETISAIPELKEKTKKMKRT
jgi:site-specific recombinase XerD